MDAWLYHCQSFRRQGLQSPQDYFSRVEGKARLDDYVSYISFITGRKSIMKKGAHGCHHRRLAANLYEMNQLLQSLSLGRDDLGQGGEANFSVLNLQLGVQPRDECLDGVHIFYRLSDGLRQAVKGDRQRVLLRGHFRLGTSLAVGSVPRGLLLLSLLLLVGPPFLLLLVLALLEAFVGRVTAVATGGGRSTRVYAASPPGAGLRGARNQSNLSHLQSFGDFQRSLNLQG